jgi:hypothetical protein
MVQNPKPEGLVS